MDESYTTLESELRHEIEKIKGSRFIATVAPIDSAEGAATWIERVRREYPDARHHCWAWRTGSAGERFRFSDDGEPGGSAGRPILQQLEASELTDVGCVVTRYFGGTKLGVGGLVRAYGTAAREALARAPRRTVVVTASVVLDFPYECAGSVQGLLAALGIRPARAGYADRVRLELDVPVGRVEECVRGFRDATAGRGDACVEPGPD